ncbi:MAG: SMP-30/Gluconolactonase/LRE-like region, partial [Verrucomicrobiota bacterium]
MKPPTQTSLRLKTLGRALTLAGAFLAVTARAQSPIALKTPGYQPSGLAYNGKSLFVAENSGFRRIHTLDPLTGASRGSFLAPSPTGLDGQGNPNDLVSDGAGRLFVCDLGGRVYEIDEAGTKIFQSFAIPFRGGALAFDGRLLYISDQDSGLVRVTDRTGRFVRNFQSNLRPAGMVFDAASRNLWVISQFDGSVTEMSTSGVGLRSLAGPRKPGVQGLGAITKVGSSLYVAEVSDPDPFNAPEVPGTIFSVDVGLFRTPGYQPSGLAYDGKALFISENSGFRTIHKVHPTTGAVLKSFLAPSPTGFDGRGNPNDLAADGAGRLFVSDLAGVVYEIDDAGTKIFQSFALPFQGGALAFDGTYLYAADSNSG